MDKAEITHIDTTPEQEPGARLPEETVRNMGDTAIQTGSPGQLLGFTPYESPPLTSRSTQGTPVDSRKRPDYGVLRTRAASRKA